MRRRVTRRLTKLQTMCKILKYRNIVKNGSVRLRLFFQFTQQKGSHAARNGIFGTQHEAMNQGMFNGVAFVCIYIKYGGVSWCDTVYWLNVLPALGRKEAEHI